LTAPLSSSAGRAACSCRGPAVSTTVIGMPPRSAHRWSLVEKPPRLRPRAAPPPPLAAPRRRAGAPGPRCRQRSARTNPTRRRRRHRPAAGPGGGSRPRPAASGGSGSARFSTGRSARAGCARDARAQPEEDAVDDRPIVLARAPASGVPAGEQRAQALPLPVGEGMAVHTVKHTPFCRHALVAGIAVSRKGRLPRAWMVLDDSVTMSPCPSGDRLVGPGFGATTAHRHWCHPMVWQR
jgi:hypothetical protein